MKTNCNSLSPIRLNQVNLTTKLVILNIVKNLKTGDSLLKIRITRKHILFLVLVLVALSLVGCNRSSQTVQGEYEKQIQDFIRERIGTYSAQHFSKLEECKVTFSAEDRGQVYTQFIPDFGSITFKNEIWHWSALHALNLTYLFPEIKEYHYAVFDANNNKLMDLYLDEVGIKALPNKFYGQRGPGNYYRYCFTTVEETEIGRELPIDENFFEGSGLP